MIGFVIYMTKVSHRFWCKFSSMQNSMKCMYIDLEVVMYTQLRSPTTSFLNDFGPGQGYSTQGQMAKVEGNNNWTSGHVQ